MVENTTWKEVKKMKKILIVLLVVGLLVGVYCTAAVADSTPCGGGDGNGGGIPGPCGGGDGDSGGIPGPCGGGDGDSGGIPG